MALIGFYSVERQTILLVNGEPLGIERVRTSSAREMLSKAAKRPLELFPRVTRTDALLFMEECQGPSLGKMQVFSRPMKYKMTIPMIDGSNVNISH